MKKILAIASFVCFVSVNSTFAQTAATQDSKQSTEAKAHCSPKACCKKSAMKNCSAEQKAKCEAKAKAEAAATKAKKESTSAVKQ